MVQVIGFVAQPKSLLLYGQSVSVEEPENFLTLFTILVMVTPALTPLTCFVVEDEPLAQRHLIHLIAKLPHLVLLGTARHGREALDILCTVKTDLLLLYLLALLPKPLPYVLVTTANDPLTVDNSRGFINDFLLKPITAERFNEAIYRISRLS